MEMTELLNQAKQHPVVVAISLCAALLVGALGGGLYMRLSEQRVAVLDERVQMLELQSQGQKKVNKVIIQEVGVLRAGFNRLPSTLSRLRGTFHHIAADPQLAEKTRADVRDLVTTLDSNIGEVQAALDKAEAIASTFEDFLNASIAESLGRFDEAAELYQSSAEHGNPEAQFALGRLYLTGNGVAKD